MIYEEIEAGKNLLILGVVVGILIGLIFRYIFDEKPPKTIKEQTPGDIFRALGAVLKSNSESEDGVHHNYLVEYQGGYFNFTFLRNSSWVAIQYYNFKECAYEHLHKAYAAANELHIKQSAWNCTIAMGRQREDGTPTITAGLEHLFSSVGNLEQMTKELQTMLSHAFVLAREFSAELDKAIKEDEEKDEKFFNDYTFNNKLAMISRQMEAHHTADDTEEEGTKFFLSVHQLVQLYEDVDLGCLLSLKMVQGDSVEHITDISAITAFDVREYIRQHAEPTSLNSIVLIYEFEHQTLFVNLTKAKGSTDNTLYYIVNVVRSGDELDQFMDNRTSMSSRTMLEVRLSDEDKAAWEAKYMIDDAMDKISNGKESELTDEQRLAVAHTHPTIQSELYWGKKYFNHRCYYQALYHFNRVFRVILNIPYKDWEEGMKELFYDICYYIGFIYADLGMNVRACYYLNIARESNRIDYIEEFVNCICNMRDPSAMGFVVSYTKDIQEKMGNDEEEAARLMPMYQFFQCRLLFLLVEYKKWDDAEIQANYMIQNDMDVEFANDELEHIRRMREKEEKEKCRVMLKRSSPPVGAEVKGKANISRSRWQSPLRDPSVAMLCQDDTIAVETCIIEQHLYHYLTTTMKTIKELLASFKKEEPQKPEPKPRLDHSLERFVVAQERMYPRALEEVKNGRKVTHWIWYIFPQLKGLGTSNNSLYYGLDGIEEARAYLAHPVLGTRLREITTAVLQSDKSVDDIFGGIDTVKVRSCMTLFNEVVDDDLFAQVLEKCFEGKADNKTTIMMKPETKIDCLLGAIAGDVIGSIYEFRSFKGTTFPLFSEYSEYTDDTVMTVANADWLLSGDSLLGIMQEYGHRYPTAGYGGMFKDWLWSDDPQPYGSWGNGSAMRVSPVGWAFDTLEETLEAAKQSAAITHNHPEGIKGAQATAACIYLARTGKSKEEIKEYVENTFGYNLSRTCDEIRPVYQFDGSCQGTVPESIIAFLESTDYESAIRLTVSLGGDADTMGAITGGIAEAFYGGVPEHIKAEVVKRLPDELFHVMSEFYKRFVIRIAR